jgi:hypothetical protein
MPLLDVLFQLRTQMALVRTQTALCTDTDGT